MKPLDPRLTRYARAARRYIATTAVTGVLIAGLVVAQAWLISRIVAPLMAGGAAGAGTASLVRALAAVVAARAAVVHFQESRAHRAATRTIIELRRRVVAHAAALGDACPLYTTDASGERSIARSRIAVSASK